MPFEDFARPISVAVKVALDFLTQTWALELAPRGIRVVSVAPGMTDTPVMLNAGFSPEQIEAARTEFSQRIPLGRIGAPDEVALWIVSLARPEASYVTGAVLRVDGGAAVT